MAIVCVEPTKRRRIRLNDQFGLQQQFYWVYHAIGESRQTTPPTLATVHGHSSIYIHALGLSDN